MSARRVRPNRPQSGADASAFGFRAQFKLTLAGNVRPAVGDGDGATFVRLWPNLPRGGQLDVAKTGGRK